MPILPCDDVMMTSPFRDHIKQDFPILFASVCVATEDAEEDEPPNDTELPSVPPVNTAADNTLQPTDQHNGSGPLDIYAPSQDTLRVPLYQDSHHATGHFCRSSETTRASRSTFSFGGSLWRRLSIVTGGPGRTTRRILRTAPSHRQLMDVTAAACSAHGVGQPRAHLLGHFRAQSTIRRLRDRCV